MDPSIFKLASDCLQLFGRLGRELDVQPTVLMPLKAIQSERGRFRVWCGNLGALQQSFASLDYRLRDAPIMLSNVVKLLHQLQSNLAESEYSSPVRCTNILTSTGAAVVSGSRLPFEAQGAPQDFSDSEMMDDEDEILNELSMRLQGIIDVIKNLYTLGFKIRNPLLRPSSVKASHFQDVDPETNIDVLGAYAEFDRRHVHAMLELLRREPQPLSDLGYLASRLATANTVRRRQFRYWQKHGQKLSLHATPKPEPTPNSSQSEHMVQERVDYTNPPDQLHVVEHQTMLSVTEAAKFEGAPDDRSDAGTVMSFASTALDADGHRLKLPNPPQDALQGRDFVCPYCSVICPAKYGQRKAWR